MATKKAKGKKPRFYTVLQWSMMDSKAFLELSPSAGQMLPHFLRKVRIPYTDPKYHFQEFEFTYEEALKKGCAKRTFNRVIRQLMRHGFIDPVSKGGADLILGFTKNRFHLSDRWRLYKTPTFKEIHWEQFNKRVPRKDGQETQSAVSFRHKIVAKKIPAEGSKGLAVCQKDTAKISGDA